MWSTNSLTVARGVELEDVRVPTVAAIEGYCVGGGLAIAAVCDLRVSTRSGRLGMPIARTLGNCLSMNSMSILVAHLGPATTLDLLLRARLLTAAEAHAAGFVAELCDDEALEGTLAGVVDTLLSHAPLTMWAAKVAVARLRRANLPNGDDFVARVWGSEDFRAPSRHSAQAARKSPPGKDSNGAAPRGRTVRHRTDGSAT